MCVGVCVCEVETRPADTMQAFVVYFDTSSVYINLLALAKSLTLTGLAMCRIGAALSVAVLQHPIVFGALLGTVYAYT